MVDYESYARIHSLKVFILFIGFQVKIVLYVM